MGPFVLWLTDPQGWLTELLRDFPDFNTQNQRALLVRATRLVVALDRRPVPSLVPTTALSVDGPCVEVLFVLFDCSICRALGDAPSPRLPAFFHVDDIFPKRIRVHEPIFNT